MINSTGPISLSGTTAGQSIALELGQANATAISLNDTTVRTLAGKLLTNEAISFFDFYNKTGVLINGSTVAALGAFGIAISPDGLHVYVTNISSNTLSMFLRDTTTGGLTLIGTVATEVTPAFVAIPPDGASVYVTNATSGTVSLYIRNRSTGVLTNNGKISTGSTTSRPWPIVISADGKNVYVGNVSSGELYYYKRNAILNTLTFQGTTGAPAPYDIAIAPNGVAMYAINGYVGAEYQIKAFTRNTSTGVLAPIQVTFIPLLSTTAYTPIDIVIAPNSTYAYVLLYYNNYNTPMTNKYAQVVGISLNPVTGDLISWSQKSIAATTDPRAMAISPNGNSLYIASGMNGSNRLDAYTIAANTLLSRSSIKFNSKFTDPNCIAVSPDGTSVYVTDSYNNTISMYHNI